MKTIGAREAADCLNVSTSHILRLLDKGEIPFTKVGNRQRVKKSDLDDYRGSQHVGKLAEMSGKCRYIGHCTEISAQQPNLSSTTLNPNKMGYIKQPKGVDLVVEPRMFTVSLR
jgi:excisionase family DNA binding protein